MGVDFAGGSRNTDSVRHVEASFADALNPVVETVVRAALFHTCVDLFDVSLVANAGIPDFLTVFRAESGLSIGHTDVHIVSRKSNGADASTSIIDLIFPSASSRLNSVKI